jgi:hypothetical protein
MKATDNVSLFEPHGGVWKSRAPVMVVVRTDKIEKPRIMAPRRSNDTLYLAPGDYAVVAGWSPDWYFYSYDGNITLDGRIEFNVSLIEDMVYEATILLPSTRMIVIVQPNLIVTEYELIYSSYDRLYFDWYMLGPVPDTFSLPPFEEAIGIDFRSWAYAPYFPYRGDGYQNRVETNEQEVVTVLVTIPVVQVLGLAIDYMGLARMLLVGMTYIVFVLLLRRGQPDDESAPLYQDPRIGPALLLGISILFPWFTSVENYFGIWPADVYTEIRLPLLWILKWTSTSLSVPASLGAPGGIIILPVFVLFWIPFTYFIIRVGKTGRWDLYRWDLRALVWISLLGIVSIPFGLYMGLSVGLGAVAAVSALPFWLIQYALNRRRWNQ